MAVATSYGSLHKYICELIGKKEPWEIIEGKIQERFSEFSSPVVAQLKLSTFTQSAMTMHGYISEFTRLVGHAYKKLNPLTLVAIYYLHNLFRESLVYISRTIKVFDE